MGRLAELQKQFYEQLGTILTKYGFAPHRASQSFHRKNSHGWDSIHLAFIRHQPTDFDAVVDVEVRIDAVEELTYEASRFSPKSRKPQTATFGVEMGNLSQGGQRRWPVADASDIEPALLSIEEAVVSIALPYFQKFSDLEEVLATLSRNDSAGILHMAFHDKRCKSALALAYVMGKYDLLEKIIHDSETFLTGKMNTVGPDFALQWERHLEVFRRFAAKIRLLMQEKGMT